MTQLIIRYKDKSYYSDEYMDQHVRSLQKKNNELTDTNSLLLRVIDTLIGQPDIDFGGYVQHKAPCRKSMFDYMDPCECGLDELMKKLPL